MKASLLCLVIAASGGAESYNISLKAFPDKGKSAAVTARDRMETKILFSDDKGKEVGKEDSETVLVEEYLQATLEVKGKKLVKFSREYTKASATSEGKARDLPFAGKTVTFTVGEKGCTHDLKEKLVEGQARRLADAHTDGLAMVTRLLPGKEVALGATWKISGKQVAGALKTLTVDPDKSEGTGKLVSVERKNGRLFGTLAFTLSLQTREEMDAGKASGTFELKVVAPIDASGTESKITIKTLIRLDTTVKDEGKNLRATVAASGEYTGETGGEK
jgi:hypothetical protein